jgi:hypothetical protein
MGPTVGDMVYRYESDEDASAEYPRPGTELSVLAVGPPAPAGPSPSRFPTPSLPRTTRTTRVALPAADPVPVRSSPPPPPPTARVYTSTQDLPRSRPAEDNDGGGGGGGGGGGRLWQVLIGGAAVLVLLALCGLGAAALLADRTPDPQAAVPAEPSAAIPSPTPGRQDIDSRDTDQAPLTAKEVFPGKQLAVADGQPAYAVLKTQASGNCAVAATGEVADLLVRLGCNQVVRATLRSPDGDHLVTTGLFNLTDLATAQRVRDRVRPLLDERQGRFRGMPAGDDTEAVGTAAARVGWQVRGHYVAYCLVTRADGEPIKAGDAPAREILYDMIELYLNRVVLERRVAGGTASQPTVTPGRTTGSQSGAATPNGE